MSTLTPEKQAALAALKEQKDRLKEQKASQQAGGAAPEERNVPPSPRQVASPMVTQVASPMVTQVAAPMVAPSPTITPSAQADVIGGAPNPSIAAMLKKRPLQMGVMSTGNDESALTKTLRTYFGYDEFRPGQLEVIQSVLSGQDVCVFWATGAGKSLCYQVPALHSGKSVFVVSPLISLMTDQVVKFNMTAGSVRNNGVGPRACFLGTAATDGNAEMGSIRGEYSLVYLTPEKLDSSYLDRMKELHRSGGLAMIAIDEAHCISEWGHDFRPSYRNLNRVRDALPGVPVMTLTATAVPKVQEDIGSQLRMTNPHMSRTTFDRKNLQLACVRKNGLQKDLSEIANSIGPTSGSTIIYAPTQGETETIVNFLSERFSGTNSVVGSYHGGMNLQVRERTHLDFLSGYVQVVVATVAFGMGIDKPDIRNIVHYGPPKTVEEYLQQVGRAGRDGLPSVCKMFASDNDFSKYAGEFYTKGLTPEAKQAQLASTDALRTYSNLLSTECRRKWLLDYFGEVAPFQRCGTCDLCVSASKHGNDSVRDFRQAVAPLLEAVHATSDFPRAVTYILQIISGTFKSRGMIDSKIVAAMERIKKMRVALPPVMIREAFSKEMISVLCSEGYLSRKKVSSTVGQTGYQNVFDVYQLTQKGVDAMHGKIAVMLAVPQAVRQQEEDEVRKKAERVKELQTAGIDVAKIPEKEIDNGEGQTLRAVQNWIRRLKHFRDNGKEDQAKKNEELLERIEKWRKETAHRLHMAPAAVLSEQVKLSIAYCRPTTADELRGVGVRIAGVEELATLIRDSTRELFPEVEAAHTTVAGGDAAAACRMVLPVGMKAPPMKWPKAVYKAAKGKLPAWELSYNRWKNGDLIKAIAMSQPSGKAVMPKTVVGHILTAFTFGHPVDLSKLVEQGDMEPPCQSEWEKVEEAAATRNCHPDADDFARKQVLGGILGDAVDKEYAMKTEEEKALEAKWYSIIDFWVVFKRVHLEVVFEEPGAKRQKC